MNQVPRHGSLPSKDFEDLTQAIPEALREKALEWYELGIKRGMRYATDRMADGTIHMEKGQVLAPHSFELKLKVRFAGGEWEPRPVKVRAADIGFTDADTFDL